MKPTLADDINTLAAFCTLRDIPALTQANLQIAYNFPQADAFVLFGGTILAGIEPLVTAMKNQVAKKYLIVGGQGHTTDALRDKIRQAYPMIATDKSEAEMFNDILYLKLGQTADYLEVQSTNCGNNITNLLKLLTKNKLPKKSLILSQDATMQRRMSATLEKFAPQTTIINYASYTIQTKIENRKLQFDQSLLGMWEMEQYITLLLGEISRLQNTPSGYGPLGKDFIAPVFIPEDVLAAFHRVAQAFPNKIRTANSAYAKELAE